ncbi:MAG: response regulator [Actinomycetota bacterium]
MAIVAFEGIDQGTVRFIASVVPGLQVAVEDEPAQVAVFGADADEGRIRAHAATAERLIASARLSRTLKALGKRAVWITDPVDRDQLARAVAGVLRRSRTDRHDVREAHMRSDETIKASISLLQAAVVSLVQGSLDSAGVRRAREAAGEVARELRRTGAIASSDLAFRVAGMFAETRPSPVDIAAAVDALSFESRTLPAARTNIEVLVIGFDEVSGAEIVGELQRAGFGGLAVPEGSVATAAAVTGLLVALVRLAPEEKPAPWINELAGRGVTVMVLVEPPALSHRKALVEGGASIIIPYGSGGARLGRLLVEGLRGDHPTVTLVVGQDAEQRGKVLASLAVRGVDVVGAAGLPEVWGRLREDPTATLVMLDTSGSVEVDIRMIRSDPSLVSTEIICVQAHDVSRIRFAGADTIVGDPELELFAALDRSRRRRAGIALRASVAGAVTGVELGEAEALFDSMTGVGSVATFVVDGLEDVVSAHGRDAAESVRRRVLLAVEDVASRLSDGMVLNFGPRDSLIVAPRTSADELVIALESAVERLSHRPIRVGDGVELAASFSAGVAERGRHGERMEELASAARRTVRLSERTEKTGQVVKVGWLPDDQGLRVEVLLVDADDATSSVVEHAMDQAGLSFARVASAESAARFIAEGRRASVILTEISLPGVDGFELLRILNREGVLRRSKVIMLTRRATEEETIEAFRMGAYDHVSKPFSPSVLVQRVRRARTEAS